MLLLYRLLIGSVLKNLGFWSVAFFGGVLAFGVFWGFFWGVEECVFGFCGGLFLLL